MSQKNTHTEVDPKRNDELDKKHERRRKNFGTEKETTTQLERKTKSQNLKYIYVDDDDDDDKN